MSAAFRTRQIAVTSAHYEALSALAEMHDCSCADEYAQVVLTDFLKDNGQLDWLMDERKKRRTELQRQYMTRLVSKEPQP